MRYSIKDYSISAASKGWGQGWPACTARTMTAVVTAPISGVKTTVHKRVARLAYLLIAETERRGYLLRSGQTWGGNCRAIANTTVSSNHAWWIALDINSLANPYIKKGLRVTDVPGWMVLLWNSFGWAWGGIYGDSMHWEFMGSPEDADEMTALAEVRLKEAQQRDGVWVITDMEDNVATDPELVRKINQTYRMTALLLGVELEGDPRGTGERTPGEQVLDTWVTQPDGATAAVRQVLADGRYDIAQTRSYLGVMLGQILAARSDNELGTDAVVKQVVDALIPAVVGALGQQHGITREDVDAAVRGIFADAAKV